ncbi:hypothetical protein [Reinekea blandensis]|uniref:Uncharacterized protein n=1 Tax=Reinekea blandensis MED297 TaxID=314283 RepID=A4BEU1_9GAMM|nr:hypothetical protein [Reinekea blandensis]EAR09276.1 hypothetical protein MED297_18348 [Reinekea sp. MED297] [Reinekea blandensis MED297]
MEIYWLGLTLFLFFFVQAPLYTGPLYWISFLVLTYVFTFPGGPAQSIHRRLKERRHQPRVPCAHCQQLINAQDVICAPCKLELSLGARHR